MKRHPKMRQKTESVNEDTENYHYSITVFYIFKKTEERLNSMLKRNTKNIKCIPILIGSDSQIWYPSQV